MVEWILLILVISVFAWRAIAGAREYQELKAAKETAIRQRIMASWFAEGMVLFGIGSVIVLAIVGRLPALLRSPTEFMLPLPDESNIDRVRNFGYMICAGLVVGSAVPLVVAFVQRRADQSEESSQAALVGAGDFTALYPRNSAERIWAILMSLSAGITEEMMFRVALPLLLTIATGNMWVAFALSIPLFGMLHYYQGWKGVAATSLAAILFTIVYLATASLLLVIVVHVWIDINALVLVPLAAARDQAAVRSDESRG